jgi:hypothetical protein
MVRNGNFGKNVLVLLLVFAASVLMVINVNAAQPSELITGKGCTLMRDSFDEFSCWVKKDTVVTFKGPAGYTSYIWTGSRQSNPNIMIRIMDDIVLTLTLDETKVKTVKVKILSPVTSCELEMSGIAIESTSFTVGQRVPISVDFKQEKCPGVISAWMIDEEESSGLFIENKTSEQTWLVVKSKPATGKNPTIRFRAGKGIQSREVKITLSIGDNSRPMIKSLATTPSVPLSHNAITVDCKGCFSGNGMNDTGDYIAGMAVTVKKVNGTYNQTFSRAFRKGSTNPVSVSIGSALENDFYTLEAWIIDSKGVSSEKYFDIIFVDFGNTIKDMPDIKIKPVICREQVCTIDTSEMEKNSHGLGLSIRYYVKTVSGKYEELYNTKGKLCTTFNCTTALAREGSTDIKVTVRYIRFGVLDEKFSEKIVTVCVGCIKSISSATIPNTAATDIRQQETSARIQPTTVATVIAVPLKSVSKKEDIPNRFFGTEVVLGIIALVILVMVWIIKNKIKEKKETRELQENTRFSQRRKYQREKP